MPSLSPAKRFSLLQKRLASHDAKLREFGSESQAFPCKAHDDVEVVVGTSSLLNGTPDLADELTRIIDAAYSAVEGTGPRMLEHQPVSLRLRMGDHPNAAFGLLANCVLHVAFKGGKPVGCISSSYSTMWTEPGVGHWGLLVVEPSLQGQGIATKLVMAAEDRISEACESIKIEYDFIPSQQYSSRLKDWYEKLGYIQRYKTPRKDGPGDFCHHFKSIPVAAQKQGQTRKLQMEREAICKELASLETLLPSSSGCFSCWFMKAICCGQDRGPSTLQSAEFFDVLSQYVRIEGLAAAARIGAVCQFVVADAGLEGEFTLDLKEGKGSAAAGRDANADITIRMTDADMFLFSQNRLDVFQAFWEGRCQMLGGVQHLMKFNFGELLAAAWKAIGKPLVKQEFVEVEGGEVNEEQAQKKAEKMFGVIDGLAEWPPFAKSWLRSTLAADADGGPLTVCQVMVKDEQNYQALRDKPRVQKARIVEIMMEKGFAERLLTNLRKLDEKEAADSLSGQSKSQEAGHDSA